MIKLDADPWKLASRNARRNPTAEFKDKPDWLTMRVNADGSADLYIYGIITPYAWFDGEEVSASQIAKQLQDIHSDRINVYIKSDGGSVYDGVAIYTLLREHKARINVRIDSMAGSIASVIAMAGDEIAMAPAASYYVHRPASGIFGYADTMRKEADILDMIEGQIADLYAARSGKLDAAEFAQMMAEETNVTATRALEIGLADKLLEFAAPPQPVETDHRDNLRRRRFQVRRLAVA